MGLWPKYTCRWPANYTSKCNTIYYIYIQSHLFPDDRVEEPAKKSFYWRFDARAKSTTPSQRDLYDEWRMCAGAENIPEKLRNVFIDFNTTLPSSAPVERLFSLGKRVLTPTRTLLSDKHFEILIMLASK